MSDPVQDRLQKLKGDPVAARLARLKEGTVEMGPVQTLGTSQEERTRALTQAAAGGDIAASLELAQSQSNLPAMARSQEAIRPTTAGTAANIFFSDVLSPILPKTAALGTEMAIDRFTESGGDAAANANLFGLASAGGALAGNYGLMRALPNAPGLAPGMSLKEIGQRLLYAGAVEGGQGAAIAGGGALAEGATPEEAARFAAEQFAVQGTMGAAFRALPGAGAIRSAIRGDRYYPEGRTGRVVREIPPNDRPILSSEELAAKYPEPFQGVTRTPMEMAEVQLRRQIETDPIPPAPRTGEPATPGVRRYTPANPLGLPALDEAGALGKRAAGEGESPLTLPSDPEVNLRLVNDESLGRLQQNLDAALTNADDATRPKLQADLDVVMQAQRDRVQNPELGALGSVRDSRAALEGLRERWEGRGLKLDISTSTARPGTITLSRIVVPEGRRGGGVGSEAMRELVALADRTGQTIVLTPSTSFGASSVGRLKEFYKRFGFVENVGRNKDFTTRETMYRVPANTSELGVGAPRLLASTTGGIGGAAYGYATGDTPEERRRRAWVFGLGGLAAGYATGAAAENIGARGTAGVAEQATEALSRGAQTAERMERRGPQMSQRRTEFAVAPARERLVPNLTAGDSPAYVNLTKFGLEADAQKRLAEEATRVGVELQGDPRRKATWNEWREAAKSLGVSDIVRKDAQALDQTDLLATRNLIAGNTDRLIELDAQLADPTLTVEMRSRVALEQQALDAQNAILLEKFIPARTAAGRRLNSLKIIASRTLDPAWWLGKAQDVKGSPLTDIEAAQVRKFLAEQNRIGLVQFVSGIRPSSNMEKAVTYWKANLLTNPRTHAVNVTSNAAIGTLESVKDIPGALADQLMGLATGRRTTGLPSVRQMTAAAEGAREGLRQAKLVMRGVPMAEDLAKYDIPREVNFDNPVLDGYTKFVFRSLGASDRIFRMAAVRRSLANQAEVLARTEGLKGTAFKQRVESLLAEPSTEMSVRAMSEAEQAVFQDETQVGKALGAIGRFAPGGIPVGEVVMPFRRTPGAVATRIGEYTLGLPAGLAKISARAAKGELSGMSPEDQRQLATLLGRGATGASLIAAGYLLARNNLLTPPAADWSSDRNQAQTDAMRGVQGNSLVIGDTQLDIGRLSPVGNLLAIGAMAAQAANDRDPETSPWAAGALGMVKTVANQPFLQGLEQVQEAVKDPARAGTRVAEGVTKGFVPASSAMGAAARVVDPTVRRRDGVVDAVAGQVPGVSQGFPEQFDPLGRPVQREGGWQGALSQVILPTAIQTKRHSQVLDALGEYGVTLGGFKPEQGESNEVFATRARESGTIREEELEKALRSPAWAQDTSYEGRQALLEAAKRKAASRIAKAKRDNAKPDPVADRLRQLRTP